MKRPSLARRELTWPLLALSLPMCFRTKTARKGHIKGHTVKRPAEIAFRAAVYDKTSALESESNLSYDIYSSLSSYLLSTPLRARGKWRTICWCHLDGRVSIIEAFPQAFHFTLLQWRGRIVSVRYLVCKYDITTLWKSLPILISSCGLMKRPWPNFARKRGHVQ